MNKTNELVFRRPHPTKFDMPCALDGIVQEHVAKLLGVFFSDKLDFEDYVNFVLTVCSQRIYLLKLLKSQGLPPKQLQTVFTALILARMPSQSGVATSTASKGSELMPS